MAHALQILRDEFGPWVEHANLDPARYGTPGYVAADWVAFEIGAIRSVETQRMSLFHGTSAGGALKIHHDGFRVFPTSVHGGKSGLFGHSKLVKALQYAKLDRFHGHSLERLTWLNCPVVVEYKVDPDQEYYEDGVWRGKCLQHYNATATDRDELKVWRHPIGGTIYGYGDGDVPNPENDPIGISNIWLHVHKHLFTNYLDMGSIYWEKVKVGELVLCRSRVNKAKDAVLVKDFMNEWTCCSTATPEYAYTHWIMSGRPRKLICQRCYEEFGLR